MRNTTGDGMGIWVWEQGLDNYNKDANKTNSNFEFIMNTNYTQIFKVYSLNLNNFNK